MEEKKSGGRKWMGAGVGGNMLFTFGLSSRGRGSDTDKEQHA